jgi:hypothetical protein
MARPERVWRDRDSSNDARSSSSGSEDENLEEELKLEVREGKAGKEKGRREIPSSTAETVSQELVSYMLIAGKEG